jgi:hypothetical protein
VADGSASWAGGDLLKTPDLLVACAERRQCKKAGEQRARRPGGQGLLLGCVATVPAARPRAIRRLRLLLMDGVIHSAPALAVLARHGGGAAWGITHPGPPLRRCLRGIRSLLPSDRSTARPFALWPACRRQRDGNARQRASRRTPFACPARTRFVEVTIDARCNNYPRPEPRIT